MGNPVCTKIGLEKTTFKLVITRNPSKVLHTTNNWNKIRATSVLLYKDLPVPVQCTVYIHQVYRTTLNGQLQRNKIKFLKKNSKFFKIIIFHLFCCVPTSVNIITRLSVGTGPV